MYFEFFSKGHQKKPLFSFKFVNFTAMSKTKKLTKEEELLLQDFGRNVSTKSSVLFYCNALIVSAVPLCKWDLRVEQQSNWFLAEGQHVL